ncbi:hypothetical protein [Polycladomyces subterraneus]|uniref:Uncharacterized protein n=1 Tax=Polycladomyces subterraneus TaxID=1016997 RepID=A0ABT8IRP1_9BACL|nr:hypothetical protein [Polycladomyces subterraneus]MDN4595393.1 hypothetical protein [Polycladomyces subterraneus]
MGKLFGRHHIARHPGPYTAVLLWNDQAVQSGSAVFRRFPSAPALHLAARLSVSEEKMLASKETTDGGLAGMC